jgi:hypothetical protein
MRRLLLLGLVLALAAGCKKGANNPPTGGTPTGQAPTATGQTGNQPSVHAPTGVVINPGISGGSGGAVQAVRTAVRRTVNLADLEQLRLFIETASLATGQMPSKETILAELKTTPTLLKPIQDGAIVLTGTKSREHIWAYTADPQSAAGEHLVMTSSSIERMPADMLRKRLQQEAGQ